MAKNAPIMKTTPDDYVRKVGLIDVGSGTIRLVVYGLTDKNELTKLFTEKANCSLGESVARDGKLDNAAVTCAANSIQKFQESAQKYGVDSLHAFGTAAAREASNQKEFLDTVHKNTGITVDVISGEDEASCQFVGSTLGIPSEKKRISGDLGRTSLDVAVGKKKPKKSASVLLGSAAVSSKGDGADQYISSELDKLPDYPTGKNLHLVGGSWRRMAYAYLVEQGVKNPKQNLHGTSVDASAFFNFLRKLENVDENTLRETYKIPEHRIPHLPAAIATLRQFADRLQSQKFVFSMFGAREGYLLRNVLNKHASDITIVEPAAISPSTLEAA